MSKRVRTLLRVSSKQQLHNDDIPVQRAEAEQYIAKQPEWIFDKEYIEKAVSAYKNSVKDREVLKQILEDAREKQFEVLLTYMSDRIGRQEEYSFYVATLNQLGIEVWTIKDGQLKTQEHVDKLLNFIRFWQNEGESKKTGMRVRDARKEMVKAGKFVGGKAPYGYHLIPSGIISNHGRSLKKLEIVEAEADVVRKIYHLAVYQGMGYEKIAKTLNKEGVRAITTDKWKSGTIAGILKNPVYMGYYAVNRRVNQGGFTRLDRKDWIYSEKQIKELEIISPFVWEKAQDIRETRKDKLNDSRQQTLKQYEEQYKTPFTTKGKLVLLNLAYCGYCGRRLKNGSYCNRWTTKAGEEKVSFTGRYVCPNKCPKRSCYSQDYLETVVFNVVADCLKEIKTIDISKDLAGIQEQEMAGFARELEQIVKEQKNIRIDRKTLEEKIPAAIRGDYCFSPEKLSMLIKEKADHERRLNERAEEIKEKAARTEIRNKERRQLLEAAPDWGKEFQSADKNVKQMFLSSLIKNILVKDDDITITFRVRPEDFTHETGGFGVPEQGL